MTMPILGNLTETLHTGLSVYIERGTNHDGGRVFVTDENVALIEYGMMAYGWHVTAYMFIDGYDTTVTVTLPSYPR